MNLKTLICINCKKQIKNITYYDYSDCIGPTYFIAHKVLGPQFFDIEKDLPLCGPLCGVEYDNNKNTRI